jgi:DNA-binding NarL/FixJ family response regulator
MLRSGLETLGPQLELIDIPSGEEALLEATRKPIQLLIADVRLAGMTGLELRRKILKHNPDLKVILITGVTDPNIRRQVADAGADAFFLKPIEMSDFLEATKRCLGLFEAMRPATPEKDRDRPSQALVERLSRLRGELKAISTALLDDRGRVLATAGNPPDGILESSIMSSLMKAFATSEKVSHLLGVTSPHDLLCFEGSKYNLSLSHAGLSYALLVVTNKGPGSEYLGTIGFSAYMAAKEIGSILEDMAEPVAERRGSQESTADAGSQTGEPQPGETPASATGLEDIFRSGRKGELKPEQVDAFWEQLVEDQEPSQGVNGDVLSYQQAEELGLTPDENDS